VSDLERATAQTARKLAAAPATASALGEGRADEQRQKLAP
jgi:hypothetical protein